MKSFYRIVILVVLSIGCSNGQARVPGRPPNVVLIFADDLGYGDLGCYGAKGYRTPHLDRMAREGARFSSFCVPQAVCSASRAALLTGCYPNRIGILGALGPGSNTGLHASEMTMAEALKRHGYATAIFGKWHLGDTAKFSPLRHGFDEYFGLPYSNDMWPKHPTGTYPDLPLMDGERVVGLNPDQSQLTRQYTDRAVRFIEAHRERPFFLYLPHSMPHVPLFASERFRGRTSRGLFGDVLEEIDDSVGRVLEALRTHGLDKDTLVIFTSDNGPWLSYGNHAGAAPGLREGKGTTFEGGVRVPCVMRWPGVIPRGLRSDALATTMDLFPTVAAIAGVPLPAGRVIDGRSILPLMLGDPGARSPHDVFLYYWGRELQAIRSGRWKLHFPHGYPKPQPQGNDGGPGVMKTQRIEGGLFDLETDPAESRDMARSNPRVVELLQKAAEAARLELGDSAKGVVGSGIREPGKKD